MFGVFSCLKFSSESQYFFVASINFIYANNVHVFLLFLVRMDGNAMELQMDEHLTNLQRDVKATLERFKASGVKMDKKFVNYIQKLSIDR